MRGRDQKCPRCVPAALLRSSADRGTPPTNAVAATSRHRDTPGEFSKHQIGATAADKADSDRMPLRGFQCRDRDRRKADNVGMFRQSQR